MSQVKLYCPQTVEISLCTNFPDFHLFPFFKWACDLTFLYPLLSGKVFLDFKAELEEVYKIYCQNHDDAISLLESYEKDESIQRHVLECLERLRWVTDRTKKTVWKRVTVQFLVLTCVFDLCTQVTTNVHVCVFLKAWKQSKSGHLNQIYTLKVKH